VTTLLVIAAVAYSSTRQSEAPPAPSAALRPTSDLVSDMVLVPAGDYPIGDDAGPSIVRPRHVEHLAPFRLGRTEVSVGEYAQFVTATRAPVPWGPSGAAPDARLPVTRVPFGDAENFCAW